MKVVLLAGGFESRISEESQFKPKPMIEIGGMPILWHIMKEYAYYGHNEFIICAGYKQEYIKEWFNNYFLHNSDVSFDFRNGKNEITIHESHLEPWKVTVVDTGYNTMTGGRIKRIQKYVGNEPFMMTYGDAVIFIEADLQTPPSVIPEFITKWEKGALIVAGVKEQSKENFVMFRIRKLFYSILGRMSETPLINNFLGVGLYDQTFINLLRKIDDPCPYFRGLVSELGSNIAKVNYVQEVRKKGKTSFSFYRLYDVAMLGFVNYTKLPLRLASFIGLFVAFICLVLAGYTFIYKIINWNSFEVGQAAISVGIFFLGAVQLIFLGIIGEYISAIYLQIRKRPLVIEKERVNFDKC